MSQKPKYQLELVLDYALPVVLERGFAGCNMQTLLEKTGFNRRAFYQHFDTKIRFFEALVAHYIEHKLNPLFSQFSTGSSVYQSISSYFNAYEKVITPNGCLLVKMLMEVGHQSETIQGLGRHFYDNLTQQLIGTLEKAQISGELSPQLNVEKEALQLTFLTQSFAVSANLKQGKEDIHTLIQALFESPATSI
ncbi:TetR/AcrR family transcriptional regulator [Glaciecola sp. 1036]|uniref:TetR/AcrR family transcriptional regulator n=1 Tax=Alteromonadaceae TaxID=72275 RepID=UPI003D073855